MVGDGTIAIDLEAEFIDETGTRDVEPLTTQNAMA